MEEDIKILEWSQQQMRLGNLPNYSQEVYKAIENLLKAYKELKGEKRYTKYLLNKKKFFSDWYIGEIIMCEDIKHLLEEE